MWPFREPRHDTMPNVGLTVPDSTGTREHISDLFEEQRIPMDLTGQRLAVFCRRMRVGSATSADELVRLAVDVRNAKEVVLVGAPRMFVDHCKAAARRRRVKRFVGPRSAAVIGPVPSELTPAATL